MSKVINFADFKQSKQSKANPEKDQYSERLNHLKDSLKKINSLMEEIRELGKQSQKL